MICIVAHLLYRHEDCPPLSGIWNAIPKEGERRVVGGRNRSVQDTQGTFTFLYNILIICKTTRVSLDKSAGGVLPCACTFLGLATVYVHVMKLSHGVDGAYVYFGVPGFKGDWLFSGKALWWVLAFYNTSKNLTYMYTISPYEVHSCSMFRDHLPRPQLIFRNSV
jgi:hypothetical protein